MEVFSAKVVVPVGAEEAFAWHEREGAFERLCPPWERVELVSHEGGVRDGAIVKVRVHVVGPVRFTAVYRHSGYDPGRLFVDEQMEGPFRFWRHEHRFTDLENGKACLLEDYIQFKAPLGGSRIVRRRLEKMFAHRHRIFHDDMMASAQAKAERKQTIVLTGGTGMVGSALRARLSTLGHSVRVLSRNASDDEGLFAWDVKAGKWDERAFDGVDAVIHLAGAPIAERWTEARKREMLASRVDSTRLLVKALEKAGAVNARILSASGINYYGYEAKGVCNEDAPAGGGFLAGICREWEGAWAPLVEMGAPVAFVRTGIVLSPKGGALARLLPPFLFGIGGPIGRGQRQMSWISLEDLVEVFVHLLEQSEIVGPVNAVSPQPVSNAVFSRALGRVLKRPAVFPVPPAALRLAFGEMADETILGDLAVEPSVLKDSGFVFRFFEIEEALRGLLSPTLASADAT